MSTDSERWALDNELAFASAFTSTVASARAALEREVELDSRVVDGLCRQLCERLSQLAASALHRLFAAEAISTDDTTSTSRYRAFVSRMDMTLLAELRDEFVVLGDLIEMTCRQWVVSTSELLRHCDDARSKIASQFDISADDPIVAVQAGLGDRHNHGRTVALLETEQGHKLIYKPRSLAPEDQFFAVWRAFRAQRDDETAVPTVISSLDHGFMQFVKGEPIRDRDAYWRRAGELVGLLHLCAAEDLHYENLIATNASPVPVDLECINQPNRFVQREDRMQFVTDSVLATGMFPNWFVGAGADAADAVGLFAGQQERPVGTMTVWQHLGSDAIDRVQMHYSREQGENAPLDPAGSPLACNTAVLRAGMEAAFNHGPALVDERGEWPSARFLSRPTAIFAASRTKMLDLDALRDAELFRERSRELPLMEPELESLLGADRTLLVQADSQALCRLDIPIHHCVGASLLLDGGGQIGSLFEETGAEHRRERVRRLDSAGVRYQQDLATLAIEQFEQVFWVRDVAPFAELVTAKASDLAGRTQAAAEALGVELQRRSAKTNEGPAWLEVDQRTPLRGTAHQTNLYAGSDGIALFFAGLARATGSPEWARSAQAAFAAVPSQRHAEAWAENGWSGRLYARSVAADLLDDPALRSQAQAIADQGFPRPPSDEDKLDVLGGWSGVLLSLLAARSSGVRCEPLVVELTSWLAAQVEDRLDDSVRRSAIIRMGFAHGTTGMSYALAAAGSELGNDRALHASRQLAAIEEERVAGRGGVPGALQGLGEIKVPERSWCWGVSGYAMARSQPAWRMVHGQASHLADAKAVLTTPDRSRSHACCGEAGQLLALVELARNGHRDATSCADALASTLADEALDGGPWQFYHETTLPTPGLFWGLAGIGYALLRHRSPGEVPNFLLFQPAERPAITRSLANAE